MKTIFGRGVVVEVDACPRGPSDSVMTPAAVPRKKSRREMEVRGMGDEGNLRRSMPGRICRSQSYEASREE